MIKIVDSHNKVLSFWAEYRNSNHQAPRLLTLDHHTDTSPPFRNWIKKQSLSNNQIMTELEFHKNQIKLINELNFKDSHSVQHSIEKLNNDEHIVAAIKSNIISSAFVIAHNAMNTSLQTYQDHKIICRTVNETNESLSELDHDSVLESSFLKESVLEFNKILNHNNESSLLTQPYILDIDLDYFNTFASVSPKDLHFFKELAINAELITIATEPEYVKSCALDESLTSEYLLDKLMSYLPQ